MLRRGKGKKGERGQAGGERGGRGKGGGMGKGEKGEEAQRHEGGFSRRVGGGGTQVPCRGRDLRVSGDGVEMGWGWG